MKALSVYKLNILNILYFMAKCKYRWILTYFATFLLTEQKSKRYSKMKILLVSVYAKNILVSIAFYIVEQTFGEEFRI